MGTKGIMNVESGSSQKPPYSPAGGAAGRVSHSRSCSSALLFGNGDSGAAGDLGDAFLSPTSPWLLSPLPSSDEAEMEVDMCQLVEDGLLEEVVMDSMDEGKAALATRILENIDQLIDLEEWIKSEEPFTNWLEDKSMMAMMMMGMDSGSSVSPLPTFGEVLPEPVVSATAAVTSTHSLLREFESVFDSVEELGKQQQHQQVRRVVQVEDLQQHQLTPPESPHMAEVEALVRCRAEEQLGELLTCSNGAVIVPPSPSCSSCSSRSSGCYYDDASNSSGLSSVDPDCPDYSSSVVVDKRRGVKRKQQHRNSDEKRSRKKEQNKNAATRYRQKKKAEVEEIAGEERDLQTRHDQLSGDVADVQREIRYLKSLMRDLFRAKGLL